MKTYQPQGGRQCKFALRSNTYRRMWYLVADYWYFLAFKEGNLYLDHYSDEQFSKTELAAISKVNFDRYIEAIEEAQKQIPEQLVAPIMLHITDGVSYEDICYGNEGMLERWEQRFIWHVARNMGEI